MIRLMLVDDHPVVRDGLRGMFDSIDDIEVVGEASDGEQAVLLAVVEQPDVVVMDLRMPGAGGVEAIRELRRRGVTARVLVLTTFDADADVLDAVAAGATGYLLKDAPGDELVRAVRSAHKGDAVLSPAVASRLMSRAAAPPAVASPGLSKRELEVLRLVAAGATNREAARTLFISETTVKTHLLHLFEKLGVRDRASAVDAAHRAGLLG
ncbi:response regulator transcription factor [Cryptosporangium phraense]|uniref:Response regulator transcription factor n=2 Tax=Cryptosporangium phraense TaxID=2593070 RepID=A0A545AV67_9ACTN|nr:response regulator transcription factor [Cryptosporangium phraense]